MSDVVGQWEHYAGQSWQDALIHPAYKPDKMKRNITRVEHEGDYYFSTRVKRDMHFASTNGRQWYSTQGNHRSVIARFLHEMVASKTGQQAMLHNVGTAQYTVDWETLNRYQQLVACIERHKLRIYLYAHKIRVHSENRHNSMIEHSAPLFFISDYRFGVRGVTAYLNSQGFRQYANWVIKSGKNLPRLDNMKYWWQSFSPENKRNPISPNAKTVIRTGHNEVVWLRKQLLQQRNSLLIKY